MTPKDEKLARRPTLATAVGRGIRLRCPVCGRGQLFRNWFRMFEKCADCGLKFDRGPGYYLGSIYFNYGLTALVVAIAYPVLLTWRVASRQALMAGTLAFVVLFPVWFFRYARSLWLGFDHFSDPRKV